jgi:glycosyltransferase involved in cell wall biosynthesis
MWPISRFGSDAKLGGALGTAAPGGGNWPVRASRLVFGDGIPRRFRMSDELASWLHEFRPELIYGFLGSMAQIRVTEALATQFQLPLAIHIMDDWPAVIYRSGLMGPLLRRTVMGEFRALLDRASLRLGICEDMCVDYRERFGFEFHAFHNAVDMAQWRKGSRRSWANRSPFVVRYAGSILEEAQQNALRDICVAVGNLRREGQAVEMLIHSPAKQRAYLSEFSSNGVHLYDSPEPDSIVELLASADLLVLPFNFEDHSAVYLRLSMPTKIPAYMASSTPILVYGPDSIAPVRYAMREQWARVVNRPGVPGVQTAIKNLIADPALRETYARRAMAVAADRHDAVRVRVEFQSMLSAAAQLVRA